MSAMMDCFGTDSLALALAEPWLGGIHGVFGGATVVGSGLFSCHFSPTHSPNPGFWGQSPNSPSRRLAQRERRNAPQRNWCLTPITQRGGLHVAASLKVGTLRSTARWPQSEVNPATGRHSQIRSRISSPALDFSGSRPQAAQSGQALPQRQLASSCLPQLQEPRNQFDGNAPLSTFFPPSLTRPHVAVSSLSAPKGVERVGVRGGVQRLRNKHAADNQFGNSNRDNPRVPKELQKQERTMHITRGLEARNPQSMMATAQLSAASWEPTR